MPSPSAVPATASPACLVCVEDAVISRTWDDQPPQKHTTTAILAREAYARVQAARGEIVRLLRETSFDQEDLAAIRAILDQAEAALRQKAAERQDERPESGRAEARRLGAGWLDQKMIQSAGDPTWSTGTESARRRK